LNRPRNTLREDPARDSITLATPTQMYPVPGYLWRRRSWQINHLTHHSIFCHAG